MKQTDVLKRIEMPNPNKNQEHACYQNKLQPEYAFESEKLKAVYQRHEVELLSAAEKRHGTICWIVERGIRGRGKIFHVRQK